MREFQRGTSRFNGIARSEGGTGMFEDQSGRAIDFAPLDPDTGKSNFDRRSCGGGDSTRPQQNLKFDQMGRFTIRKDGDSPHIELFINLRVTFFD